MHRKLRPESRGEYQQCPDEEEARRADGLGLMVPPLPDLSPQTPRSFGEQKIPTRKQVKVWYFKQLITDFAKANNNRRPTVEELQELVELEGMPFTVAEIKTYGHLALEEILADHCTSTKERFTGGE